MLSLRIDVLLLTALLGAITGDSTGLDGGCLCCDSTWVRR